VLRRGGAGSTVFAPWANQAAMRSRSSSVIWVTLPSGMTLVLTWALMRAA
jgi:hypothetical protein